MQDRARLRRLEAEAVFIFREVVAEGLRPVLLYSIGKDSSVLLHLALKAFHPAPLPFPLLHIDTGWKFREMIAWRDTIPGRYGVDLRVHVNPEGAARGIDPFTSGAELHTRIMKTEGLKQALAEGRWNAAFGGARRDEERSRAKERIFSFRNAAQVWDPKNQRPELWSLYNGRVRDDESIRVFPLSNWTEGDVWDYIGSEDIPIVPLYFAAERPVVRRGDTLIMVDDARILPHLRSDERIERMKVRFRTLGCYPLSGAIASDADTLDAVLAEMADSATSERQGRLIDGDENASMEAKKREGYF